MIFRSLTLALALLASSAGAAEPQQPVKFQDAARGPVPIMETTRPPLLANPVNDDIRRSRNYDMQPPTIPHKVDSYQIDKNFNKCMDCHARAKTELSQAVPVSVTHYVDRNGKVLGQISTRRYFCMQCHVPQEAVRPIVNNQFEDVDTVIRKGQAAPAGHKK